MATRIVEGKKPYTGGKAIEIDENKVISLRLRDENNLIIWDEGDNEIYVDLQLPADIEPTDAFPVGITTGRVSTVDGWDKTGTIICAKTTNGDNIKLLYADDGTLYIDNGTGTFKQIYLKGDIDAIVQAIYQYINANFNTKTFFITGPDDEDEMLQEAYTWVANGGEAILYFPTSGNGSLYISEKISHTGVVTFKGTLNYRNFKPLGFGLSQILCDSLNVYGTNGVVTSHIFVQNELLNVIEPDATYDTPYNPQYPWNPATKKYVDDKVAELMALGKFLSLWSCADGEPMSFPLTTPYTYTTGDYYLVGELATGSNPNLKPDGSSYDTGDVSTVVESAEVQIGDVYIYDGTVWMHQLNHERTTTFANIAGQPTDNQNLATALGDKQDTLVNQTNIKSVNNNSLLGSGNLVLDTVPSGGTQGQVLTKQSVGYGWANPTGGDVQVSTQANNIFTPGMKIWGGYETDFNALTPDNNTVYYVLEDKWRPGANTLAYYPLTSSTTVNDSSANNRTLTNYSSVTFGTAGGVDCATFDGTNYLEIDTQSLSLNEFTMSCWMRCTNTSARGFLGMGEFNQAYQCMAMLFDSYGNRIGIAPYGTLVSSTAISLDTWYNVVCISTSAGYSLYINGLYIGDVSTPVTISGNSNVFRIGLASTGENSFIGQVSKAIFEDVAWSAQDISDYFDLTKGDYGIN